MAAAGDGVVDTVRQQDSDDEQLDHAGGLELSELTLDRNTTTKSQDDPQPGSAAAGHLLLSSEPRPSFDLSPDGAGSQGYHLEPDRLVLDRTPTSHLWLILRHGGQREEG